ncbi:hypothetical protein OIN60_22130 [Paenibacillus sp. P96]|uniref:Uncharacterized protein n=1 Tax=Paenibacillus zeirhizosphaerae TaxID=2987519 RepID=A0ABT9FXF8_9BACL|nr:hypothetical protein [Paenibacillus sp. P96]MDP4099418.1 hypothetical protein [Paenibacillus sp. P96]
MQQPYDELLTTFSRTKEDAARRIMQSFQAAGLQNIDLRAQLGDTIATPKNTITEELRRTFDQIQGALNEHYPHHEDTTSYQDLWSEVNRVAFPPLNR